VLADCPGAHLCARRYSETCAAEICEFCVQRQLSSHMILPRRPFQPVLRNSRWVEFCLDRLNVQVVIPRRCGAVYPEHAGLLP
jgi:hypothetical protein